LNIIRVTTDHQQNWLMTDRVPRHHLSIKQPFATVSAFANLNVTSGAS
jgi:hypothetical protein